MRQLGGIDRSGYGRASPAVRRVATWAVRRAAARASVVSRHVGDRVQRFLRGGIGRAVDDEPLAGVPERREHVVRDRQRPGLRMQQPLLPVPVHLDVVAFPQPGELLALPGEPFDQTRERRVLRVGGPGRAQVGDELADDAFAVAIEVAERRMQRADPHDVALVVRQVAEVEHEGGHLGVPRADVETMVDDHRRQRRQGADQLRERPRLAARPASPRLAVPGQVEQVHALVVGQP